MPGRTLLLFRSSMRRKFYRITRRLSKVTLNKRWDFSFQWSAKETTNYRKSKNTSLQIHSEWFKEQINGRDMV